MCERIVPLTYTRRQAGGALSLNEKDYSETSGETHNSCGFTNATAVVLLPGRLLHPNKPVTVSCQRPAAALSGSLACRRCTGQNNGQTTSAGFTGNEFKCGSIQIKRCNN